MSLTVARTGWPCAFVSVAKTSQSVAGQAAGGGTSMPRSASVAASLSPTRPASAMPARSPFTSARNTGTPIRLKPSASFCSVTVLPVPVAPVTRPCRLAISGRRKHPMGAAPVAAAWLAIRIGSGMAQV